FDDTEGINAEMKADGVQIASAGNSVLESMKDAVQSCEADLGIDGPALREHESELERRETVLEKIAIDVEDGNFVKKILYPISQSG
nr:hypothetical protein [Tanacetum cinerariifolium]